LEEKKKMTKIGETYRCEICGNVVEVLEEGGGQLVCCGEAMKLIEEDEEEKE
jgi:desulfoferrodoxin-like iron-binding protein